MAKQIPLNQHINRYGRPLFAIVDDDDYGWLSQWKWTAIFNKKTGARYVMRGVRDALEKQQRHVLMHRVIMKPSDEMEVDHINGDGFDNRRENLRIVSRTQNLRNRKTFKRNKSGFKGVTYNPVNRKWKATINLGTFDKPEQAARAYDEAIKKLFGRFAKPNFAN